MGLVPRFFKQLQCDHLWQEDASFYQLEKDANKTHWLCTKCHKRMKRDRWDKPEKTV